MERVLLDAALWYGCHRRLYVRHARRHLRVAPRLCLLLLRIPCLQLHLTGQLDYFLVVLEVGEAYDARELVAALTSLLYVLLYSVIGFTRYEIDFGGGEEFVDLGRAKVGQF